MTHSETPRLGIFGGSFHPPHKGHVEAARAFLETAKLDLLFVIPTYLPPHKTLSEGAEAKDRLEMARLAFSPLGARVRVLSLETDDHSLRYTYDTVRRIREDFPEHELFLYVGSDMLLSFETWHKFEALLGLVTLCYASRQGDLDTLTKHARHLEAAYGARTLSLGKCQEISSEQLRKALLRDKTPQGIPHSVLEYIENHALYRKGED